MRSEHGGPVGRPRMDGPALGYPISMTTTPYEPQEDPDIVPSGDPIPPDRPGPAPDPGPDPDLPPPTEPEVTPV